VLVVDDNAVNRRAVRVLSEGTAANLGADALATVGSELEAPLVLVAA
jgi:CheY-like chemotaxis protein